MKEKTKKRLINGIPLWLVMIFLMLVINTDLFRTIPMTALGEIGLGAYITSIVFLVLFSGLLLLGGFQLLQRYRRNSLTHSGSITMDITEVPETFVIADPLVVTFVNRDTSIKAYSANKGIGSMKTYAQISEMRSPLIIPDPKPSTDMEQIRL